MLHGVTSSAEAGKQSLGTGRYEGGTLEHPNRYHVFEKISLDISGELLYIATRLSEIYEQTNGCVECP